MSIRTRTNKPALNRQAVLPVGIAVALAALLSNSMPHPVEGGVEFWPANGIVLAFLLTAPLVQWPHYIIAGFAGVLLAGLISNVAVPDLLIFALCNGLEIVLAATLIRQNPHTNEDVRTYQALFRLLGYGAVLAPLTSAFAYALYMNWQANTALIHTLYDWFSGHALGTAIIAPALIILRTGGAGKLVSSRIRALDYSVFALVLASAIIVFWQSRYPILFIIPPALVLAAFRLGILGATAAVAMAGTIAVVGTIYGYGPIAAIDHISAQEQFILLDAFVASLMLLTYPVAVSLTQKHRLMRHATESEKKYKFLIENSADIAFQRNAQQQLTYLSPSVTGVLGWEPEEGMNMSGRDFMHPNDIAAIDTPVTVGPDGTEYKRFCARYRHKNGHYVWMENNARILRDPETCEFIGVQGTLRDITARKKAEEERDQAYKQLESVARQDGLTGLANRRHFDDTLQQEWARASRNKQPLTLLIADVDYFKRYNDLYGHVHGDECLRTIAQTIQSALERAADLAARYGGEEFAVILPETDLTGGETIAQRLSDAIASINLPHAKSEFARVTLSIGIATYTGNNELDPTELIEHADIALYRAKTNGRNQFRVCQHRETQAHQQTQIQQTG